MQLTWQNTSSKARQVQRFQTIEAGVRVWEVKKVCFTTGMYCSVQHSISQVSLESDVNANLFAGRPSSAGTTATVFQLR